MSGVLHLLSPPHSCNIVEELALLCGTFKRPYVIFRDPLFSVDRDRALALADAIRTRGLDLRFECETRIDRLEHPLGKLKL